MRHLRIVLPVILWIAGVTWYWNSSVPLAATKTLRLPAYALTTLHSPTGEIVFHHQRWIAGDEKRWVKCGPMEFWKFPEARKTRELFTAEDEIVDGPLFSTREVMIRRAGRLLVVDSESGATLANLADVPGARMFRFTPDRRRILVGNATDLLLFEVGEETPRWTAPFFAWHGTIAGDIFIAARRPPASPNQFRSNATAMSLETGQPDPRFDHLGSVSEITLSSDGRFAIVSARNAQTRKSSSSVCHATTGRVLWPAPAEMASDRRFSPDGEYIYATRRVPNGLANLSRWRAADGVEVPFADAAERGAINGHHSPSGRYSWKYSDTWLNPRLTPYLNYYNSWCTLLKVNNFRISQNQIRLQIIDTATDRALGYFPQNSQIQRLSETEGFIGMTPQAIRYYAMPPGRDWSWLALWILCPPAAVWLVSRLWRFVRSCRVPAGDPA